MSDAQGEQRGPRAEDSLIQILASTEKRRRQCRAETSALLDIVDLGLLEELLRHRRLLGVIGPRLLEAGDAATKDRFERPVADALATGERHGALLEMLAARAVEALSEQGIPAAVLKGPALSRLLYGQPGRRLSSDVDLLVAPAHLDAALSVLRKLGYASPQDHVGRDGLPRLHFAMEHTTGQIPAIELHWRVHWYETRFAQERLLPPSPTDVGTWRPAPHDELAAMLLFYARDGFVDLRLAADVAAFWDECGESLDVEAFDQVLRSYPALERVLSVAARVAGKIVGLPVERLDNRWRRPPARSRIAYRLAQPYPHDRESQVYADIGLIDGLLTPWSGVPAFLRRQILIPRQVRVDHARSANRRTSTSIGHGARVLARYGFAMAGLLRSANAGRRERS